VILPGDYKEALTFLLKNFYALFIPFMLTSPVMEKRNPNIIVEESDLITNFLQIINGLLLFGWNIWKISISKFPILIGRRLVVYYKSTGNLMDKKMF
jgi:hypothetical protein